MFPRKSCNQRSFADNFLRKNCSEISFAETQLKKNIYNKGKVHTEKFKTNLKPNF